MTSTTPLEEELAEAVFAFADPATLTVPEDDEVAPAARAATVPVTRATPEEDRLASSNVALDVPATREAAAAEIVALLVEADRDPLASKRPDADTPADSVTPESAATTATEPKPESDALSVV